MEQYEEVCPKCGGAGFIEKNNYKYALWCPLCKGNGFIDWIDKIKRGKKLKNVRNKKV